jgi:hypothetical protein
MRAPENPGKAGYDRYWSVAVSEWLDRAAALRCWNSVDCQPLKAARKIFANCEVLLVGA